VEPENPQRSDAVTPGGAPPPGAIVSGSPTTPPGLPTDVPGSPAAEEAPPPPLTPVEWAKQNGWFFVALAALIGVVLYNWGPDALFRGALVVVGLSLVIVIHELGHFLAAKWCDVHVMTFSLGFGPAFPGCSFKRGETTYKIGMIPLGGFVQMVGEGSEADEDESYPRSFKNKPVWQRMVIISAGVVMNVILGCVCFIIVYQFHGLEVAPAAVGAVEAGSPAWKEGIPSGSRFTKIGGYEKPDFLDLKATIIESGWGEKVPVTLVTDDGRTIQTSLTPRLDANDDMPVIGVQPPNSVKLLPALVRTVRDHPFGFLTAAASARAIDLLPGDVVLATTDADGDGGWKELPHDLKAATFDAAELSRRLRGLGDKTLRLSVLRAAAREDVNAKPEAVAVPPGGFAFDDLIVGVSDPDSKLGPFDVASLALRPEGGEDDFDVVDFERRMMRLAGKPAVLVVRRHGVAEPIRFLVPPAFHRGIGATMKMGEVVGVRVGSPADRDGIQAGDVIDAARVYEVGGPESPLVELSTEKGTLDPLRLPYDLQQAAAHAADRSKLRVGLTVRRWNTKANQNGRAPVDLTLEWDDGWAFDRELPLGKSSAEAVPQLGLAYRVESTVVAVASGSPADKAGLKPNDVVQKVRFQGGKSPGAGKWSPWEEIKSARTQRDGSEEQVYDQWAAYDYMMQAPDFPTIQVRIARDGKLLDEEFSLTFTEDESWGIPNRGLELSPEYRLQKANNSLEALGMGATRTWQMIRSIYRQMVAIATRRISTKMVGGPIAIATQAYEAARDPFSLLFLLGFISLSLAVINFLPIPVLDGGHMVFLIYELVRRRPASDAVRAIASYVGLAVIGVLMILVFYQDIAREIARHF
jgi:regulator of sigma E protease